MRLKLNILLITLLALLSCAKEGGGRVDYGPETGNLYVRFDVSDMTPTPIVGVKEDNEDEGHVLLEDGVMRKGRMWLVDKDDNVVVFRKMEDSNSNSMQQTFTNVKRGKYKLYILFNSTDTGLDGFKEGSKFDKKKCLAKIESGASPEYTVESGVPCSIVKDVAIAAGKNYVDVSLQRCVGRLTVVVLNNIHDCKLAIGGIGLSAVNPSTGYYFPQSDGSVPHYTNLAFHDLASTVVLPPSKNKIIFDRYIYETKDIPEGLSFRLFGAVYGGTKEPTIFGNSFVDPDAVLPNGEIKINYIDDYGVSKLLTRIKRNEHVTVSINVSYDREYMQFDFTVKAWVTKDNKTTFD